MQATVPAPILDQPTDVAQARQPSVDDYECVGWSGNMHGIPPRAILGSTSTSDDATIGVFYWRYVFRHRETGRIVDGELAHGTFADRRERDRQAMQAVKERRWDAAIELAGKLLVRGGGR